MCLLLGFVGICSNLFRRNLGCLQNRNYTRAVMNLKLQSQNEAQGQHAVAIKVIEGKGEMYTLLQVKDLGYAALGYFSGDVWTWGLLNAPSMRKSRTFQMPATWSRIPSSNPLKLHASWSIGDVSCAQVSQNRTWGDLKIWQNVRH